MSNEEIIILLKELRQEIAIIKQILKHSLDQENYLSFPKYAEEIEKIIHRITREDREFIRKVANDESKEILQQ